MVKAWQTRRLDPVCPIAYLNRAALMNATDRFSRKVISELKKICKAASIIEAEQELERAPQYCSVGFSEAHRFLHTSGLSRSASGSPAASVGYGPIP
jgi:hypothetical protein